MATQEVNFDSYDVRVTVARTEDVVEARQQGRSLAISLGFARSESTLIAAAISELARNIVRYAGHGEIVMRRAHDGMLYVVARDNGPGIADVQAALRSGHSTSGGLGLGLPGVRRIADHFEIVSSSRGTTVTFGKKRR